MRIVRLAALLGSLMLLVATTVSIINSRAEDRSDQTARVETAADVISTAVRANVRAAQAAVEIAGVAAAAPVVDRARLATEIATMFDGSDACVGSSVGECTGPDLFALASVGDLAGDTGEQAIVAVDPSSNSVLIVHRPEVEGNAVTIVVRVPIGQLLSARTAEVVGSYDVDFELLASSRNIADVRDDAAVVDGDRTVEATIGEVFVDGSIQVRTSIDGSVDFAGERPVFYLTLLALGTVLLALAGWTFFLDRRSLQQQASTDELTGLINRREFERVAEEALDIASRFGTGLCMMVIDLNGFKQVNDTLGHQFGDLVLKASSERLAEAVRDTDVVGRWGGDEFVIMLPGLEDRTAVRNSAERISSTLGGSPVVGDTVMTASIGAAIFPRHGTTFDALMRAADVAMYGAKTTGVGYQIADTIAAQEDLYGDEPSSSSFARGAAPLVVIDSDDYTGPDRRQAPAESLPPPVAPESSGAVAASQRDRHPGSSASRSMRRSEDPRSSAEPVSGSSRSSSS